MTKVRIDTPGATVEVDADGDLTEVAAEALRLFNAAGGWPRNPAGPAMGFSSADRRYTPPAQSSGMRQSPRPYPVQVRADDVPSVTNEDQSPGFPGPAIEDGHLA